MRTLYALFAAVSLLARPSAAQNDTSIAVPPDGSSCFTNTTQIFDHLVDQPPFSSNTYILCPNTVFAIGYTDSNGECCEDGDLPLMARSNTRYQCGEDGSSANNCTIFGGTLQFLMSPLSFGEEEAANVVAQGLTFTQAGLATTPAGIAGDLTFLDCIFENTANSGTILGLYQSFNSGSNTNRRLKRAMDQLAQEPHSRRLGYAVSQDYVLDALADIEDAEQERKHRRLAGIQDRRLQEDVCQLYFNNTIFRNNSQGPTQGLTATFGIISLRTDGNFVSLDNCLFAENVFGIPAINQQGYALESLGSPVAIRDTCFVQNNFIGFGPIHIFNGADYKVQNVFGDVDDALTCEFLAYSKIQPEDDSEVTCVDYDADTCQANIDPDLIPPPEPTAQPVAAPSSPSLAPNADPVTPTASSGSFCRRTWTLVAGTLVAAVSFCW